MTIARYGVVYMCDVGDLRHGFALRNISNLRQFLRFHQHIQVSVAVVVFVIMDCVPCVRYDIIQKQVN